MFSCAVGRIYKGHKNKLESAMVNEPSMFESLPAPMGGDNYIEFVWNPLLTLNALLTICLLSTIKTRDLAGALNKIE